MTLKIVKDKNTSVMQLTTFVGKPSEMGSLISEYIRAGTFLIVCSFAVIYYYYKRKRRIEQEQKEYSKLQILKNNKAIMLDSMAVEQIKCQLADMRFLNGEEQTTGLQNFRVNPKPQNQIRQRTRQLSVSNFVKRRSSAHLSSSHE